MCEYLVIEILLVIYNSEISLLFVWACQHSVLLGGRQGNETLGIVSGFNCINEFQVSKIIHIDFLFEYNNNPLK